MALQSAPAAFVVSSMQSIGQSERLDMRFQLSHTHGYPGCRVKIADNGIDGEEIAEFSDGVVVPCRHRREGDAIVLTISPHRTARGTNIGQKSWRLLPDAASGDWKIAARLD